MKGSVTTVSLTMTSRCAAARMRAQGLSLVTTSSGAVKRALHMHLTPVSKDQAARRSTRLLTIITKPAVLAHTPNMHMQMVYLPPQTTAAVCTMCSPHVQLYDSTTHNCSPNCSRSCLRWGQLTCLLVRQLLVLGRQPTRASRCGQLLLASRRCLLDRLQGCLGHISAALGVLSCHQAAVHHHVGLPVGCGLEVGAQLTQAGLQQEGHQLGVWQQKGTPEWRGQKGRGQGQGGLKVRETSRMECGRR